MKTIIALTLLITASFSHAGHLDVISFTLKEDCPLGKYMAIVDDFNAWGQAHGY